MNEEKQRRPTRILVVQQKGRGESKVKGIRDVCDDRFDIDIMNVDHPLPPVIDDSSGYLPAHIDADLVLDYLVHPDLSQDLGELCHKLGIPVIASGKNRDDGWTLTPPVCCALSPRASCGEYCRCFGYPKFDITLVNGTITDIKVVRGAPCGATWQAAETIQGLPVEQALEKLGLQTQFFCTADPANWDPIGGKSPVHLAADLHHAALKEAVKRASRQEQ